MMNQSSILLMAFAIISAAIGSSLTSGCSKGNRTPDEQTTITEKADTQRTAQRQQILEERGTDPGQLPIFKAKLAGSDKTPDRDTEATGSLTLTLQGDSIHLKGQFSDLSSTYTGSEIHRVLESEKVQSLNPTLKENKTAGTWEGSYRLTKDQTLALKGDSLFISIYSKGDESSEISGQIRAVDSLDTTNQQP